MSFLKQSTAIEVKVGPFVDSTDGVTAETALTITSSEVLLAKGAGDWTAKTEATSLVHESNGWYRCLLDTTDTATLGTLQLQVAESGALPIWHEYTVLAANVYDALIGGGDTLDVQVTGMGAGVVTASAVATDAIDADALADNAITAATFAAGAITATVIATDAIDADAIAAGAIDAAALAADAGAEIADAVWDEARSGHVAAGSFGEGVASVQGNVTGSAASVTGAVGSVTGAVGSVASGGITAASIATDAIDADAIATDALGALELSTAAVEEIRDAITAATLAELGSTPGASPTLAQAIAYLYMRLRNEAKTNSNSGTTTIANNAGTVISTATVTDAAGVFTKGKFT